MVAVADVACLRIGGRRSQIDLVETVPDFCGSARLD